MKNFIKENKKIFDVGIFILFIISTLILKYFDQFLKTPVAPNGIVSFELAQTLSKSQAIMASWNQQAKIYAGLSLGIDFLYIVIYTGFLALLLYSNLQKITKKNSLHKTGTVLFYIIFLAGLLDVIENIALIKILTGQQQAILTQIAYSAATTKFLIIILVIFFLITIRGYIFFIRKKKIIKKL